MTRNGYAFVALDDVTHQGEPYHFEDPFASYNWDEDQMICEDESSSATVTAEHQAVQPIAPDEANAASTGTGTYMIMDSGATSHMTGKLELLHDVKQCSQSVNLADGHPINVQFKGNLVLMSHDTNQPVTFTDTLYVPTLEKTLLSISKITSASTAASVVFIGKHADVYVHDQHLLRATKNDSKLYKLQAEAVKPPPKDRRETAQLVEGNQANIWHARLGHPPPKALQGILNATKGGPIKLPQLPHCEDCVRGKLTEKNHPHEGERGPKPFGTYIHADTWGPAPVATVGGCKYFVAFTEDASNYVQVYPLKSKTAEEVLDRFKEFNAWLSTRTGVKVDTFKSDNGTEFCNQLFQDYFEVLGIQHERSAPYRQYQNGTAERMNRTLVEAARTMMIHANVKASWWAEAVVTAAFLKNRTPNSKTGNLAPYEIVTGYKPDIANLKVFGCVCYYKVDAKSKLTSKANKAMMLGYSDKHRAYKVWDLERKKCVVTLDVKFIETEFPNPKTDYDDEPTPQDNNQMVKRGLMGQAGSDRQPNNDDQTTPPRLPTGPAQPAFVTPHQPTPMCTAQPSQPTAHYPPEVDAYGRRRPPQAPAAAPQPSSQPPRYVPPPARAQVPPVEAPAYRTRAQLQARAAQAQPPISPRDEDGDAPMRDPDAATNSPRRRRYEPTGSDTSRRALAAARTDARATLYNEHRARMMAELSEHIMDQTPEFVRHRPPADIHTELPTARPAYHDQEYVTPPTKTRRTELGDRGVATQEEHTTTPPPEQRRLNYDVIDEDEALHAFDQCYVVSEEQDIDDPTPSSFWEAMALPDADKWLEACQREWSNLTDMNCFQVIHSPSPSGAMPSRWVFKRKTNPDGTVTHKARLVLQGYRQRYGIDYLETYAPTVKAESMRLVLALSNDLDYEVHHADATNAYIHAKLDIPQAMTPPDGVPCDGSWHLKAIMAIYGTHQGAYVWYNKGKEVIESKGFKATLSDPCVFTRLKDGKIEIVTLYVDDFLVCAYCTEAVQGIIAELQVDIRLNDLGPVSVILGMEVTRDKNAGLTTITQRKYIEQMAKRYRLNDAYPEETPIPKGTELADKNSPLLQDTKEYQSIIGSLLYCALMTRPDITHAVSQLSRYLKEPRQAHMQMAKRVVKYLIGSTTIGINYLANSTKPNDLTCFTDSSWADDRPTGRSTCGYIWMMGGGPVSWKSKLQGLVTLSTAEAEYVAACLAAQQGCFLTNLLQEITQQQVPTPTMLIDNQSAIHMATNGNQMQRTRHMALRFNYLRDLVNNGNLQLCYCPTNYMAADMMTKHVPKTVLDMCTSVTGMGGYCGVCP